MGKGFVRLEVVSKIGKGVLAQPNFDFHLLSDVNVLRLLVTRSWY